MHDIPCIAMAIVADLCYFVFSRRKSAVHKDEIPLCEKTKRQKMKFQREKTKIPCEKKSFETIILSSFRMASFRKTSFRQALCRPFPWLLLAAK